MSRAWGLYDATNALTARAGQPAGAFTYDGNGNETAGIGAQTRAAGSVQRPQPAHRPHLQRCRAHLRLRRGGQQRRRTSFDGAGYQNTALGITTQTGTTANRVIREPDGTPVALHTNNTSYYYITDHQGSTISLIDQAGIPRNSYSYDPYGNARTKTETITNPYQYIGGQLDTTGLYHLQNRYYDPTLGRFTQPDPGGQEQNSYAYASDDSINNTDPTGLYSWGNFGSDVGGVVGGLAAGVVIAGACTASFGIGCLAAGAVIGAAAGGAGAGIGQKLGGGTDEEVRDSAISGAIKGGLSGGPAGYGIFGAGKYLTK